MARLRKQRRRKVYKYNVNRKRLRDKMTNKGAIKCREIKQNWEDHKSVKTNMLEMGLSFDSNSTILTRTKRSLSESETNPNWIEESIEDSSELSMNGKARVVELLESDARAPRQRMFRLPKGQVEWVTYLMDKHNDDYKAMMRDKKNYNQETWKQIRAKINTFKNIPEQYNEYVNARKQQEIVNI